MIIWNRTTEQKHQRHNLLKNCAEKIADLHYDVFINLKSELEKSDLYYPDNDFNFLLWTILPLDIENQTRSTGLFDFKNNCEKVVPRRKDGGDYIALANLKKEECEKSGKRNNYYGVCGPMKRGKENGNLSIWQLNTYWSDRKGWKDLKYKDVKLCYQFKKDDLQDKEKYSFLLEKNYILKEDDGYKFNVVWFDNSAIIEEIFEDILPDLSEDYKPIVSEIYEGLLEIEMENQPEYIQPQIDFMTKMVATGGNFIAYVLKYLVDEGKLKIPAPEQKKTITTLMGCTE